MTVARAWLQFLDELDGDAVRERCLHWLCADELARYDAFSNERLRNEYLVGVALCRASLSRCAPVDPSRWRFARNAYGKPKVVAPVEQRSLRFSLARTDGLAVCLVTQIGAAGVDVENTSKTVDVGAIVRQFAVPSERKRLEALPDEQQRANLFRMWVLHEAYVKGTGKGLGAAARIGAHRPEGWTFFTFEPSVRHVAAAAIRVPRDAAPVEMRWLKTSLLEARVAVED